MRSMISSGNTNHNPYHQALKPLNALTLNSEEYYKVPHRLAIGCLATINQNSVDFTLIN